MNMKIFYGIFLKIQEVEKNLREQIFFQDLNQHIFGKILRYTTSAFPSHKNSFPFSTKYIFYQDFKGKRSSYEEKRGEERPKDFCSKRIIDHKGINYQIKALQSPAIKFY